MENAGRFLNAYNQIDVTLRNIYGFKASMTFTDVVRRCVADNYIVRKYEDDLVAFARLRNAIVHRSMEDMVIAEPHTDVVELMENIAKLISTPPTALESICKGKVITLDAREKVASAIKLIAGKHFSNIPVYRDGILLGVVNNKSIVSCIGAVLEAGKDLDSFLNGTAIGDILDWSGYSVYYTLLAKTSTLSDVLNCFYTNRRLLAVILTENGAVTDQPLGIVTTADILQINEILDNY